MDKAMRLITSKFSQLVDMETTGTDLPEAANVGFSSPFLVATEMERMSIIIKMISGAEFNNDTTIWDTNAWDSSDWGE
jgi:hypothetical protein